MFDLFSERQPGIMLPESGAYNVRFNCQLGQLTDGESILGATTQISVVQFRRFWGDLGMTKSCEWGQLFWVEAPVPKPLLPPNLVCASYIKTRSLASFMKCTTQVVASGHVVAKGVFTVSWENHQGTDERGGSVSYKSAKFGWGERTPEQLPQFEMIKRFVGGLSSPLSDPIGERRLVPLDQFTVEQAQEVLSQLDRPARAMLEAGE